MDNTNDLSQFGYREIDIAAKLLRAYANDMWRNRNEKKEFDGDGLKLEFNPNSGSVFLVDNDFHIAMVEEFDRLYLWYSCPECGNEGSEKDYEFRTYEGYCSHDCADKNT